MSPPPTAVAAREALPARGRHRDRRAILVGLGCITAAAWIYVLFEAPRTSMGMSSSMGSAMQSMVQARTWTGVDFGLVLLMWAVMMVAMMVPSAVPMTLVYSAVARKAARQQSPVAPTFIFVAGYLAMWVAFAVAATVAQMILDRQALLSPSMASASPRLGASLLIAAGLYEFTPLKHACLANCRAPAHFIARHWHGGRTGAFRMGLALGVYCLGCCWILMSLLFVGGVMNPIWIVAIAAFILAEKTLRLGESGGRAIGAVMVIVGLISLTGVISLG